MVQFIQIYSVNCSGRPGTVAVWRRKATTGRSAAGQVGHGGRRGRRKPVSRGTAREAGGVAAAGRRSPPLRLRPHRRGQGAPAALCRAARGPPPPRPRPRGPAAAPPPPPPPVAPNAPDFSPHLALL